MKKFLILVAALGSLALGGCAADFAKFQNAFTVLTQTTVPASYALVLANSYDGLASGATAYLNYCGKVLASGVDQSVCSAGNRRAVIKGVRAGRPIRNEIEGYVTTQTTVPTAIYNSLLDIVNVLNSTQAASFGIKATGAK